MPYLVIAQQGPQNSLYMLDKYHFNPAYAGMDYSLSMNAVIRSQWSGLDGNPKSQNINAHLPFYKWNGSIGVQLYNESLGAFRNTGMAASYGYVVDNSSGLYSAALRVGFNQKSIQGDEIITPGGNYEGNISEHNDPILSNGIALGNHFSWSLGFYTKNRILEGGVVFYQYPEIRISIGDTNHTLNGEMITMLQKKFKILEMLEIQPSLLIKTDFVEWQGEISVLAKYNGNVFGGLGFRGFGPNSFDALVFLAGMKLNPNYTISYSYDLGLSDLRFSTEGTHEIHLNYNLNKLIGVGLNPKVIYTPRYL